MLYLLAFNFGTIKVPQYKLEARRNPFLHKIKAGQIHRSMIESKWFCQVFCIENQTADMHLLRDEIKQNKKQNQTFDDGWHD